MEELSTAVRNFTLNPNADTALDLIKTAIMYWGLAEISDDTFAVHLRQVADWLQSDR